MKIVPILAPQGPMYKVVKWSFWGRKYLAEGGSWVDENEGWITAAFPPVLFFSVGDAESEIRKQFGETAKIKYWEGS